MGVRFSHGAPKKMDNKERYIKYIGESIDDVCPYGDAIRQRMYHIGFMRAIIARLMLEDNRNYYIFKKTIEEVLDGSKK